MNIDKREIDRLVNELKKLPFDDKNKLEIVVSPPFVYLEHTQNLIKDSLVQLGAQNIFWQEKGAFTGEVSARMVAEVGCQYVILGHSERRKYFQETDEIINQKIKISLKNNLRPVVCLGENLEEKNQGLTRKVVEEQLNVILEDINSREIKKIIFAYEPIWAISTSEENREGQADVPEETQVIHKYIKKLIGEIFGQGFIKEVMVIYGGSVSPENIACFMQMPDVNGVLVGSASLNPFKFIKIIQSIIRNNS